LCGGVHGMSFFQILVFGAYLMPTALRPASFNFSW
jgi:hypothetical protein